MKREFAGESGAQALTIGKLAGLVQVSVDTVRFYEKEELLAPARKSDAGYRIYDGDGVRRLRFIRHAQECGFSLAEIRELLTLRGAENACCTDVRSVAVHKKLMIEAKIKSLRTMSRALSELIIRCDGGQLPLDACAILAALEITEPRRQVRAEVPAP